MSLALLALVHAPFAAQSATPAPATPALETLPPRACSVGAAFDERRECLVLFGGKRPGPGYVGETFEHDKGGWREVVDGRTLAAQLADDGVRRAARRDGALRRRRPARRAADSLLTV